MGAQEQTPAARRTERDPEKAARSSRRSTQRPANMGDSISLTYSDDDYNEDDNGRRTQEKKAVQILAYLAGPCVVLSLLNCFWAVISLILTLFTQPVRLCARRPSFGQQLGGLLGPALNLQLKSIYTPLKPHANEDMSYHSFALVMVHILSPFLSFVLMFVAWVLASLGCGRRPCRDGQARRWERVGAVPPRVVGVLAHEMCPGRMNMLMIPRKMVFGLALFGFTVFKDILGFSAALAVSILGLFQTRQIC